MTTPPDNWHVESHDPIETLSENLLRVEGAIPKMALRRQMLVARNSDGRLLIHNGVALDEPSMAQVEAFGEPTWLVVPSAFHRLDAARYKARYPQLQVVSPRGARAKVEKVVPVDLTYDRFTPTDTLELTHLEGMNEAEGVLQVRSADGITLIFNDALFNQPHLPGLFGALYRMMGQSGQPKVTLITRLVMLKNKRAYARQLHALADTPDLVRVIPAHIDPIVENVSAVLHGVAEELAPGQR